MKPLPHRYEVHLMGGPSGYAQVSTPGVPELRMAPPADFDGPGDAWGPEHLLLASVQACLAFTLRAVARLSKLEFSALDVEAAGTVDRQDGVTRFTEIVLRPRLAVPAGTDVERARRAVEKAEKACLISASLSTPVRLEIEVIVAAAHRAQAPVSGGS
ncbi:MAG: OsmC family protein [Acidobacteria bacterium]|nr:OsmC family protein [Acidobacteriota bacterium]